MKLFLDTNVLVDYFARREPYFKQAELLSAAQMLGDVELWVSTQSFPDIEYILRKAVPRERLRSMIRAALDFLSVLGTASSDLTDGLEGGWDELEDGFIAFGAERIKADFIITRDRDGFTGSKVPALSPSEWLDLMETRGIVYDSVDI